MILGMDPGKTNFAAVFLDDDCEYLGGRVFDYKEKTNVEAIYHLPYELEQLRYDAWCNDVTRSTEKKILCAGMERFVAYGSKLTNVSEGILMLSGAAISYAHHANGHSMPIFTFRAIDWKPALCKHLVKTKGFDNPSLNFDKKYSLAAAECATGTKFKNDHLADAACIAYWAVHTNQQTKSS